MKSDNFEMISKDVVFQVPNVIDDRTPLPQYQGFNRQKFILDLRELKLMNSVGIRNWVHWIQTFCTVNEVVLQNCPVIFLNIAAIVAAVVPGQVRIESFIIKFVEGEASRELRARLTRPVAGTWKIPQSLVINENGADVIFEFDGIVF
jgi:hypothetical protein